jgi:hypothetical protein
MFTGKKNEIILEIFPVCFPSQKATIELKKEIQK